MLILFLDLASHDGILAIVAEQSAIAFRPIDHRIDDRELVLIFENLLVSANLRAQDLTSIACVVGPGGFTSLRVACAFANALAFAMGIPVCGIYLSDLFAPRIAKGDLRFANVWWFHSTKKHELFVRGFGRFAALAPEATLMKLDELLANVEPSDPWMGELIPEHRTAMDDRGLLCSGLRPLEEILPDFLRDRTFDRRTLLSWYGRRW
ncbi:tRNA (adenosine(37)-N6)-threonylcarbamoyltransferase complex dimerization subunit type 1 TsaB [Candidatus Peregrinibacteria bacterium]|nr:tRNA (adenosine(37)-N6)-threonylcarbamoyltransferase complex dimerization subunit type 1 TsaB [Candidatus Peregrinibacteria bacterium]MBI3817020.1 tRNA (adenosine(37)-N6)-threonylcarbamoyltransferase complex dimerization subunit type 1 TsaB [Candidatus Peregrinibacteria bacterium]